MTDHVISKFVLAMLDDPTIQFLRKINWPFVAPYLVVNFGIPATFAALAARYTKAFRGKVQLRVVALTVALGVCGGVAGYLLPGEGEPGMLASMPSSVFLGPAGLFCGSLLGLAAGIAYSEVAAK